MTVTLRIPYSDPSTVAGVHSALTDVLGYRIAGSIGFRVLVIAVRRITPAQVLALGLPAVSFRDNVCGFHRWVYAD